MNVRERGFLMLTSGLGDSGCKPLTVAQFRQLIQRARTMEKPKENREMIREDLVSLGYDGDFADRILNLLSREEQLERYLTLGQKRDCYPVTLATQGYPQRLRDALQLDAPGVLWAKGDVSLLNQLAVSVVGSRNLLSDNRTFAERVGKLAAARGYVLVSGNARGADSAAQNACLDHGGAVISIVPDKLMEYPVRKNVLYLSEEGFDTAFTSYRALSRNRLIHSFGVVTFVAQVGNGRGGTWDGTRKNLQHGWSKVICFDDGSSTVKKLQGMGAKIVDLTGLEYL